jgi:inner membrane protein
MTDLKPSTEPQSSLPARYRTPAAKIGFLLGLLLLLQIPQMMVSSLIAERETRQASVQSGFQTEWGPEQSVASPMLVVPYTVLVTNSPGSTGEVEKFLAIPAAHVRIAAVLQPETRRRGLFHSTIYTASVTVSGGFTIPLISMAALGANKVEWDGAVLAMGASNLRGLHPDATMDWNGGTIKLGRAQREPACGLQMLEIPLSFRGEGASPTGLASDATIPFQAQLTLRGTDAFHLVPSGQQLDLDVTSPWPTPSFSGASLPLHTDLARSGFVAHWEVEGDAQSAFWQQSYGPRPNCGASSGGLDTDQEVGVTLQEAVPTYLMVSRAAKYEVLFLALSFLTLFLFEMVARTRIHLVQYGLLGLSISLFALLLISVAEPLGFGAGYAISTCAVMAQASLYTLAVVRTLRLAAIFAGVLGVLFGFLFIVLSLDSYALLAGTVLLFAALSVVMLVTRQVNWAAVPGS